VLIKKAITTLAGGDCFFVVLKHRARKKRRASRLPLLAIMKRKSLYEKEIVVSLWLYHTK